MSEKQSVVIIGGGPAGLTAAWELIKDGGADKYDVTVLEGTRAFGGISRTVSTIWSRAAPIPRWKTR